jgi:2-keto-4-pentenoate hydratase
MGERAVDIERVVESLWEHALRRSHYPAEWKGRLTMEQACRVQLGLLDRCVARGDRQAGWKIGLTASVIQAQFGVTEPVMGFLLESGHRESGATFRFDDLIHPGFENELCLTVGAPLQGPGVTREQVRAAIAAVQPAFEIVEGRGDFSADLPLSVADNSQQKAFVTGPVSPLPPGWEPSRTTVAVRVNGVLLEETAGSDRTGDPLGAVAWLANKLAALGRRIEAGHRIMAGSFTRQYPIARGDRLETRFTPFGAVRAAFE